MTSLFLDPHEEEKITAEGMMRFLSDLNLNPESLVVLVLAWKFRAATQCEFTRDEWTTGLTELLYVALLAWGGLDAIVRNCKKKKISMVNLQCL